MMDHDGSGTITQEEFAAAVLAANMTAATQGELRAQFDLFDTDGNGTLSLKEISKIMPHVSADKVMCAVVAVAVAVLHLALYTSASTISPILLLTHPKLCFFFYFRYSCAVVRM